MLRMENERSYRISPNPSLKALLSTSYSCNRSCAYLCPNQSFDSPFRMVVSHILFTYPSMHTLLQYQHERQRPHCIRELLCFLQPQQLFFPPRTVAPRCILSLILSVSSREKGMVYIDWSVIFIRGAVSYQYGIHRFLTDADRHI